MVSNTFIALAILLLSHPASISRSPSTQLISSSYSSITCYSPTQVRMAPPEKHVSINDLFEFMKQSDEDRKLEMKALEEKLSSDRDKDKKEFSEDLANLTKTMKDLVKSGVRDEIETAIEPIKVQQESLANEQSKLAKKVLELEKKLNPSMKPSDPDNVVSSGSPRSPTSVVSQPSPNSKQEASLRRVAVQSAKRILGFSKITSQHLQQAIDEHGLAPNDTEGAKVCAIYDFLYYEMKVPEEAIKKMKVLRTFRPARQPDSPKLYAEFAEEASTDLINRYVRNLQQDSNVDIWIPPSLYQRFRDYDSACYSIRTAPGNVKARVKYGDSDFILIKKSPTCTFWSRVVLENPSPHDPNPPSFLNPSGSPPAGRDNRDKKKRKPNSPAGSSQKRKSFRSDLILDEVEEIPEKHSNESSSEVAASLNC